jgi:excisionase family DNA binding protein
VRRAGNTAGARCDNHIEVQSMNHPDQSVDEDGPTNLFVRTIKPAAGRTLPPAGDGLWDANDVARYLKVSRSWVYQRAEAGLLACVRIGGLLRFDPHTVRTFARGGDPDPRAGISGSRARKTR